MSEPNCYRFVVDPTITAYQLAQILGVGTFWISPESYDNLPVDVQAFLEPVADPASGAGA